MHNPEAFSSEALLAGGHLSVVGALATSTRPAPSDPPPTVGSDARILRKVLDEMATRLPAEELLDSLAAFIAAAVGDGSVVWPAVGDPRLDGRPVVSHPDSTVRLTVRRALAGSHGPVPSQQRSPGAPPGAAARLRADLLQAAGGAMVTPVRRHGRLLGHIAAFSSEPVEYGRGQLRLLDRLADASAAALGQLAHEAGAAGPAAAPHASAVRRPDDRRPRPAAQGTAQPIPLLPRQPSDGSLDDRLDRLADIDRRSLAEAIADEPIQRIVSGLLTLEHLRNRLDHNARRVVDDVTAQLEDSLAWLRQLILVALTPPDLADGLGRALGALARSIFAGTSTRVTVTGPNHVPLGSAAMETAYRIFREALTNVRRHAAAESVTLRIDVHGRQVVFTLTDSGVGKAGLGDTVATRGLAAMRARAENVGGLLSIMSAPGHGTTVVLALATEEPPETGSTNPGATGRRTRSIVVCDDQQDLREAIRLVLTDIPRFQVVAEAGDGPTGLREIRQYKPDLIILDVTMPGGGPDLARAAKDASPTSHIVVFSARDDAATRDAMLAAGADQYVLKSGRLRLLLEALDNAG